MKNFGKRRAEIMILMTCKICVVGSSSKTFANQCQFLHLNKNLFTTILLPSIKRTSVTYRHEIFINLQVLKPSYAYRRPTMMLFLGLKEAFNSIDREILWQFLSLKDLPQGYVNHVKSVYLNTTSRVRAQGKPSFDFEISS